MDGAEYLTQENIQFAEPWPSPDKMIRTIHEKGMKLVLWQIPALKELAPGQEYEQHDNDCTYAVEEKLVGTNQDGSLLVTPVVEEGAVGRSVYLPEGIWYDFWDGSRIEGGREIYQDVPFGKIMLFVRGNAAITLNLGPNEKIGQKVGNDVKNNTNLCIMNFEDDENLHRK
ncbi:MAG: hypothetical protein GX235_10025 [Clostridiales bacterium]|nr:hypothetical protein [Clostridiales bacterium]